MTLQNFSWPEIPDIRIQIYRLDKNHDVVSGNKFYKLKPWLLKAKAQKAALLSCGGAYSNHLHALAYAGKQHNIATYGLVRGLETDNLTCTMLDCKAMGMQLFPVSREEYRKRYLADFASDQLESLDGQALWVPEGGTDEAAVVSCEEIGHDVNKSSELYHFDSVWLAVGSGGTLAGIARSLRSDMTIFAVPVMRNWQQVRHRIAVYMTAEQSQRIHWIDHADYGGFGRFKSESIAFHRELEAVSGIAFDPVYTSKVMRRMKELLLSREVAAGAPLMIHTGGLQGRRSVENKLRLFKT
jgi:1-aminocyclopropane-1-carboxylate deaminase/D-cysteine desulfhydrase-like pyridoxal-dependent ACC family enzyme